MSLSELQQIFPPDQIRVDEDSRNVYGRDWTTYFDIKASAVVFPTSTEQVASLVQWARRHKVSLVPSGGRTGLSGAACALSGEVVVSFEKMNRFLDFNPVDQTVVCEAGVITEALQNYAHEKGLHYPVDFAARGSSQIGGNVATNAGGIKVVRYGMTREWIAGLKVVTGTGQILELNNALVKNATGYDFRHLFIGSEGTLGFITEVTVRLAPPPPPLQVLVLAVPDLESVMKIFAEFKTKTALTAFEMFADNALEHVLRGTGLPRPFDTRSAYYVVAEAEKNSAQDEERILAVFESCLEQGWVADGALAQSEAQAKTFWRYREDISENLSKFSPYKNDVSVAISKVPAFMKDLEIILKNAYPAWEVVWFGHIGDGNLHINILRPADLSKEQFVRECRAVDGLVFEAVRRQRGSISAEHGVGLTKKTFLNYTRSDAEVELMRGVKRVFDPDNIINPGKVFG
ncbi:MAG: FAD-binding oxidoreductase [Bdellovibrionaceae bacterium]|nr:FAD-binding oxidoreductase [Pseudobdellovibrionaceae bacterium]MBX3032355.1 FAD-binding oxidoreductase [Pseudobdellovibrionaceae bacterium]